MPRRPTLRQALHPYHITTRSNDKEWFELPLYEVWNICLKAMEEASKRYPVEVISFVLMNNHYHLLLKTPNSDIDQFMREFNKRISLSFKQENENKNHVFGTRYKWCLISSTQYFANCYRYIYQNPLRANIVSKAEDYPYSTLNYLVSGEKFPVPLFDQYGFKDEFGLSWLNQSIDNVSEIKKGLRKSEF